MVEQLCMFEETQEKNWCKIKTLSPLFAPSCKKKNSLIFLLKLKLLLFFFFPTGRKLKLTSVLSSTDQAAFVTSQRAHFHKQFFIHALADETHAESANNRLSRLRW